MCYTTVKLYTQLSCRVIHPALIGLHLCGKKKEKKNMIVIGQIITLQVISKWKASSIQQITAKPMLHSWWSFDALMGNGRDALSDVAWLLCWMYSAQLLNDCAGQGDLFLSLLFRFCSKQLLTQQQRNEGFVFMARWYLQMEITVE